VDELDGGGDNDVLHGGAGADALDGGGGVDVASYADAATSVTVNLLTGSASDGDTLMRIEGVTGSQFGDVLTGSNAANAIDGGAGNDDIFGLLGADELTGGIGADRFYFNSLADSGLGVNADRITDFEQGQDEINVFAIDANTRIPGNQGFFFIGSLPFAGAQQLRFEHTTDVAGNPITVVSGDVDGDRAADYEIQLAGTINLTAGDFML
jgi:Ca2+-binding RTX toxin-like protein